MYYTQCPHCGDQLYMIRATFIFDFDAVPVDAQTGFSFDGDQVRDAINQVVECAGCQHCFDLEQDLFYEAVPVTTKAKKP